MRSNLLTKIQGLETLTTLTSLELYDNRIKKLEGVQTLVNLTYVLRPGVGRVPRGLRVLMLKATGDYRRNLDASYNMFKTGMQSLLPLHQLQFLYLASNKLTKIEGLDNLHNLVKLDLGNNRIRVRRVGRASGRGTCADARVLAGT